MMGQQPPPPAALAVVAERVEAHCGMRFVGGRRSELASKTARAFAESGCATWDVYLDGLARSPASPLLGHLIRILTVGETYFFRHRAYFDLVEREILPRIIAARRESRQLRIWSAGCATGEEAYSLAILVSRLLPDIRDWDVSILGTDLNPAYLAKASEGRYGAWSFRGTGDPLLAAYFAPDHARRRIKPEIARLVHFAPLNLADPVYPSPTNGTSRLDLVFCRNVLIYLTPTVAQQVVTRLRAALVPDGWLVLGPSDPYPGLLHGFEPHGDANALAYRRVEQTSDLTPPAVSPVPAREPAASASRTRRRHEATAAQQRPVRVPARSSPASIDGPVAGSPDWVQPWMAARAATERGDLDSAESACQQAIACRPSQADPYYLLGILHQARDDHAAALVAFRQALYVDRAFVPALLGLATLHRRSGQTDRAQRALERARRLLAGRPDDEPILSEEPVTVGRLRQVLDQALGQVAPERHAW